MYVAKAGEAKSSPTSKETWITSLKNESKSCSVLSVGGGGRVKGGQKGDFV